MTQTPSFTDLGLSPVLIESLTAKGYTEPTPVQAAAIPVLLQRQDVMASAATGTGKTAAFMLPALHMLTEKSEKTGRGPRILVLSPTRELAAQIKAATETYGKGIRYAKVVSIVGGMPYPLQIKLLSNPFEILVATPGRLIDLMDRGRIDLGRLEMLVLDEADRMLDLGFRDDIHLIAGKLPQDRVTALFSATLDGDIATVAQELLNNPQRIEIAAPARRQEQIVEKLHYADDISHKAKLLDRILDDEAVGQAIVFTATKIDAGELADRLLAAGRKAAALHGDMQQRERTRTLGRMKQGEIDVLVATDVAARGIDVVGITHVVNFDLPKFAEDYVHRIGRTGRAGREGIAISFAAKHEIPALRRIEKFIGRSLNPFQLEGLEARFEPRSPARRPGGSSPRGQGQSRFGDRKPRESRPGGDRFAERPPFQRQERGRFSTDRDSSPVSTPQDRVVVERGGQRSFVDRPPRTFASDHDTSAPRRAPRIQDQRSPWERGDSRPAHHARDDRQPQGVQERKPARPRREQPNWDEQQPDYNTAQPERQPVRKGVFKGLEIDSTVYAEQPRLTLHVAGDGKGGQARRGARQGYGPMGNGHGNHTRSQANGNRGHGSVESQGNRSPSSGPRTGAPRDGNRGAGRGGPARGTNSDDRFNKY